MLAISAVFLNRSSALAGAWVHDQNKFYLQLDYSYYQTTHVFNLRGTLQPIRLLRDPDNPSSVSAGLLESTYKQQGGSLYLEYGLGWGFEFITTFPFYMVAEQDSEVGVFRVSGLSDAVMGLKYNWLNKPWGLLSSQVDVGIPIGDENALGPAPPNPNPMFVLRPQPIPLGDGEWDVAIRMIASRSFYPVPAFLTADIGYRFRTSGGGVNFDDDIPWAVDGGYTFTLREDEKAWFPSVTLALGFFGLVSTGSVSLSEFFTPGVIATGQVPSKDFIDIQPSLFLDIAHGIAWLVSYSNTFYGKNSGAGWSIRTGLTYTN